MGIMGLGKPKTHETWYLICIINIIKHENISVRVYWDDVCIPGWKLSGWSNTRQQSVLKTAKNTVEVHLMWRNIYIAIGTSGLLCITPCAYARVTAKVQGTYAAMHKYYHNNFPVNKQNCDVQTQEWGGSAVLSFFNILNASTEIIIKWN
jgi:hypothetical protein